VYLSWTVKLLASNISRIIKYNSKTYFHVFYKCLLILDTKKGKGSRYRPGVAQRVAEV